MDAHMAPVGGVSARVEEETLANLVRCMLWAVVTLATLIACWLLFRRLGGAFAQPLGWAHLLTTAVILSATAALTRICGTRFVQSQTSNWGYWLLLGAAIRRGPVGVRIRFAAWFLNLGANRILVGHSGRGNRIVRYPFSQVLALFACNGYLATCVFPSAEGPGGPAGMPKSEDGT